MVLPTPWDDQNPFFYSHTNPFIANEKFYCLASRAIKKLYARSHIAAVHFLAAIRTRLLNNLLIFHSTLLNLLIYEINRFVIKNNKNKKQKSPGGLKEFCSCFFSSPKLSQPIGLIIMLIIVMIEMFITIKKIKFYPILFYQYRLGAISHRPKRR